MGCSVPCWTRLSETECGCWRWPHTGFDPRGARAQRLARHRAWRVTFASFPARYPLSRGRFTRRRFAVLLAAEEVACSPRLPRSPPPSLPTSRSRYQRGVTHRSARWPAPTRPGGCCGCWRRRRCSRAAARTPCWSGSSPTTVPRRGARKVWGGDRHRVAAPAEPAAVPVPSGAVSPRRARPAAPQRQAPALLPGPQLGDQLGGVRCHGLAQPRQAQPGHPKRLRPAAGVAEVSGVPRAWGRSLGEG